MGAYAYVVFYSSRYWVVYHGIENANCQPNAYPLPMSPLLVSSPLLFFLSFVALYSLMLFYCFFVFYLFCGLFLIEQSYACRDLRMQQMFFDPIGYPVLGYPVNPGMPFVSFSLFFFPSLFSSLFLFSALIEVSIGVPLQSPAGEDNAPRGSILIANFGNAWGDAAEGNPDLGVVAGKWNYTDRFGATSSLGGAWDQIFSPWNPNPVSDDITPRHHLTLR